MVKMYGKEYTKEELLSRVGDVSQLGGVRLHTLDDGMERGVKAVQFRTGSGLDFTVLADRGLNIGNAEYNGEPLAWRSSTGDVAPAFYEEAGSGWLRSFSGGLMVTCGLTYLGASNTDEGKALGLHGRASNLPASNLQADAAWEGDSYRMWVRGKLRETAVFGENIELTREISAKLGESKIWLHDKVTNMGWERTEHMLLYHCNIGFPVLDEGSRLLAEVNSVLPRDADAEKDQELYDTFPGPTAGWLEKVYFLDIAEDSEGYANAALVNPRFKDGRGIYLRYPKNELPKFVEWKNPGQGLYVAGMEPANCWVEGRAKERERGTLQFLEPGETREYHLEIGVLSSSEEIRQYTEKTIQAPGVRR